MSDIPTFQLWAIVIGSTAIWFCGFYNGKWHGIQKERARQFRVESTQRKLDASRKRGIQR
jgi:hypothetical protein